MEVQRFIVLEDSLCDLFAAQNPGFYLREADNSDMNDEEECPACQRPWGELSENECDGTSLAGSGQYLFVVEEEAQ